MDSTRLPGHRPALATGDEITRRLEQLHLQKLLAAATTLYDSARWRHRGRIAFGAVLAVMAPFAVFFSFLQVPLGVFAGIGIVVAFLLDLSERELSGVGATVMEEFDTQLYGLRWNQLLVGHRPRPEVINAADRSFRGNRKDLATTWYPKVDGVPAPYAQLLVQRCTSVWDQRQRQLYALLVTGITLFAFCSGVALAVLRAMSLTDYLLAVALPSMLAYVQGAGAVVEQFQVAARRDSLCTSIEVLLYQAIEAHSAPREDAVRDAQNILYITRTRPGGVPKFVRRLLKKRLDEDQQAAADEWKARILA